jgi:hypothetical protein
VSNCPNILFTSAAEIPAFRVRSRFRVRDTNSDRGQDRDMVRLG